VTFDRGDLNYTLGIRYPERSSYPTWTSQSQKALTAESAENAEKKVNALVRKAAQQR
jgi:hypothetical protein